ncbi:MAG: hypothetical protein OEN23_18235 [Paracoccaceae bacterium]|nr:hypothetical protein [Paracoccaceae bacterium]
MPLQTRVTPFGEIVARPWRGTLMGNRGILHDENRNLGSARWRHKNWVCCVTEFRGRHREVMPMAGAPTRYTALFFWDEPSALAAGHRPCGECRNADYRRFKAAWAGAGLQGASASEIDQVLHKARVTRDRRQVTHQAMLDDLPDGVFIRQDGVALLKWQGGLWRWSERGYEASGPVPRGAATVLTPAPTVAAMRAGFEPMAPVGLSD